MVNHHSTFNMCVCCAFNPKALHNWTRDSLCVCLWHCPHLQKLAVNGQPGISMCCTA